jgi:hypothetical protein
MKTKILPYIFISVAVFFPLTGLLFADKPQPTIITIDAPGAGTGPGQGTIPPTINPRGMIAGYYFDANTVTHSFVRDRDGIFIAFDAPGAGHTRYSYQGTWAEAMNSAGVITGLTRDSRNAFHGYLRARDGTFTTFDAQGAGRGQFQGTLGQSINSKGVIAGNYVDHSYVWHCFVRAADGTISSFDAPGAGTGPGQGTFVSNADYLNEAGATVGWYIDTSNVYHGFVRAADGTITTFDAPGAGTGPGQGTQPTGINEAGTIEALYADWNGAYHGSVRAANGTFTTFDVPGGGTGPGQGTVPFNINASGAITGWYVDASNVSHGYLRTANGTITATFDAPGAGTGPGQGTFPSYNNASEAITGFYIDSNNTWHGFLREPRAVPRPRP